MSGELIKQIKAAAIELPKKSATPPGVFLKENGDIWCQHYLIANNFIAFRGHFDEHPILPALAQVLLAQNMIQDIAGRPISLKAITQAKFLSSILPGSQLHVYAAVENLEKCRVRIAVFKDNSEIDAAFLKLNFKIDEF